MINTGLGVQHRDWHGNIESKKEALLQPGIDWDNFENMIAKARKIKIIGGESKATDMFKLLDPRVETGHAEHIEPFIIQIPQTCRTNG